jgi:hypothetical protein
VAGAAGGGGSVWPEPDAGAAFRFDDFVSRPIASTVNAGGRQGRRFAVPSDFVGCIACPAIFGPASVLWDRLWRGKTVAKSCQNDRRNFAFSPTPRNFPPGPTGLRLTGIIVHAAINTAIKRRRFEPITT